MKPIYISAVAITSCAYLGARGHLLPDPKGLLTQLHAMLCSSCLYFSLMRMHATPHSMHATPHSMHVTPRSLNLASSLYVLLLSNLGGTMFWPTRSLTTSTTIRGPMVLLLQWLACMLLLLQLSATPSSSQNPGGGSTSVHPTSSVTLACPPAAVPTVGLTCQFPTPRIIGPASIKLTTSSPSIIIIPFDDTTFVSDTALVTVTMLPSLPPEVKLVKVGYNNVMHDADTWKSHCHLCTSISNILLSLKP